MSVEGEMSGPPEVQWGKVSGPDALRPLDRTWIRYLRVIVLAAAVLIAWRILAYQEDGYRLAAEEANVIAGFGVVGTASPSPVRKYEPVRMSPSAVPVVVISPTPTPVPTPTAVPLPTATPTPRVHRVQPGDTLSEIAGFYEVSLEQLLEINEIADADDLTAGQELHLPPDAVIPEGRPLPRTYNIQPGDTLSAIAVRFGVSIADLLAMNNLGNPNNIFVGQTLQIPGGTT